MPKIEVSGIRFVGKSEHPISTSLLNYGPQFGYDAALGMAQPPMYKTVMTYVGKDLSGKDVEFTLPFALTDGCSVSLEYGGFLNWLVGLGEMRLDGKHRCLGSCNVLKN